MRLLLVPFYFPPAGGGGVQRPLKLAEHLAALGIDVRVLAPDDPKWIHRDPLLETPDGMPVDRAPYYGPRGRLPAHELHGRTGLDLAVRRALLTPRRLLVPDETLPWLATAVPKAIRLVRRERIDVVMTTSPPVSVHLLGALVKRRTGVRWVADVRDSILAKEDRAVERWLVRTKEQLQGRVAPFVARNADAAVAVTETIAGELRQFNPSLPVAVIPNGCDFEDFEGLEYRPTDTFRITHTGSFFGKRDPRPFLEALATSDTAIVAHFVGDFRPRDREWAAGLGLGKRLELTPFLPHHETLALQRDSEALLLLLPELGERGRDIPSGKLYEYLAAARPILAAVPPDGSAAAIVRQTGAGIVVPPDDVSAISEALGTLVARWRAGDLPDVSLSEEQRERFSRTTRARELADFLGGLGESIR